MAKRTPGTKLDTVNAFSCSVSVSNLVGTAGIQGKKETWGKRRARRKRASDFPNLSKDCSKDSGSADFCEPS